MKGIYFRANNASLEVTKRINNFLKFDLDQKASILNIGSDKTLEEVLGPLVGTLLQENNLPVTSYGSLTNPIIVDDLEEVPSPVIVVSSKTTDEKENIGNIIIKRGAIELGIEPSHKYDTVSVYGLVGNDFSGFSFAMIREMAKTIKAGLKQVVMEYLYADAYFNPKKKKSSEKIVNFLEYKINNTFQ